MSQLISDKKAKKIGRQGQRDQILSWNDDISQEGTKFNAVTEDDQKSALNPKGRSD